MSLIDAERYAGLVGEIYDCTLDPGKWHETFERLCVELKMATSAFSLHVPPDSRSILGVATGLSEADQREMMAYEADVVELWGGADALARPIDRPWVLSRLFQQDYIQGSRAMREWASPRNIIDCATIIVSREPELTGAIGLGRHRDAGLIDDGTITKMELFMPHLQRAARITGLLDAKDAVLRNFEAVLSAMVAPVILVRQDLSAVLCNRAAEEFSCSGEVLNLVNGRVTSPIPGLAFALRKLIAKIAEDEARIGGHELGLPVRTGAGDLHTLHILPLARGSVRRRVAEDAVAAIFVSSTAIAQRLSIDVVGPMFELTSAEQKVFELIASGRTTQEAAAVLGVAQSTVRTHLLRVFDKTGVNRQADLIRMAYALTSPTTHDGRGPV